MTRKLRYLLMAKDQEDRRDFKGLPLYRAGLLSVVSFSYSGIRLRAVVESYKRQKYYLLLTMSWHVF